MRRLVLVAVAALLASGCTSALKWEPDSYTVKDGDTLYQIAFSYGLDHRDLAAWNDLGRGNLIYPGQTILLKPPPGWRPSSGSTQAASSSAKGTNSRSTTSRTRTATSAGKTPAKARPVPSGAAARPPSNWVWPTDGRVKAGFGSSSLGGKGIDIAGSVGQPVRAAAEGEVVYSGSGLIGYGQLIIVKHSDVYLSAYGHNSRLAVREGDRVKAGETIAQMGEGPGKQPVLHFEVRQNGTPVDPIRYLPRR
jgi:lipoprotein NlpD